MSNDDKLENEPYSHDSRMFVTIYHTCYVVTLIQMSVLKRIAMHYVCVSIHLRDTNNTATRKMIHSRSFLRVKYMDSNPMRVWILDWLHINV